MKEILEPLKEYQNYQSQFDDKVDKIFDELTAQSQVDVQQNRKTVEKFNHLDTEYKSCKKKLGGFRALKTLLVVLCVMSGIAIVIGALMLYDDIKNASSVLASVLTLVIGFVIFVGMILLTKLVLDKKIKALKEQSKTLKYNADSILSEAWGQMAPLNRLFSDDITYNIVNSLDTVIKLNRFYTVLYEVYLNKYYQLPYFSDDSCSTKNMLVGSIVDNPFVVIRELSTEMGTKTYEGMLVVTWAETKRNSDGKTYTVTRSQTLIATVTKPCPYYEIETMLCYGNESAPDLHFTRTPQAHGKNEGQIERMVKRGEKKLAKIADEDRKHGDASFVAMSDTEFDILFGAFDRDNENQFRLLFTPLAQRNTIDFIKDSPFGDDFCFIKNGKMNNILAYHADSWNMSQNGHIASYSYDIAEEQFKTYNKSFFKNLYFLLAPLLNIPIYQQNRPNDMDIDLSTQTNIAAREAELVCNLLPQEYLCAGGSDTEIICKVKFKPSIGLVDNIVIYASSYNIVKRTDFVPRIAGNGRMYSVPVVWDDYIPLTKTTEALVFDTNAISEQKRYELIELLVKNDISCQYASGKNAFAESCGVVVVIPKDGELTALANSINKILSAKEKNVNTTEQFFEAVDKILNKTKK